MIKLLLLVVLPLISNCNFVQEFFPNVGYGYDVLMGNPKTFRSDPGFRGMVFNITYSNGQTTSDGRFLIPDGMTGRLRGFCPQNLLTRQFRGTSRYQQSLFSLADVSTPESPWLNHFCFQASNEFRLIKESTKDSVIYDSEAACERYSLEMNVDRPPLQVGFRSAITWAAGSPNPEFDISQIIRVFGTHFVTRGNFGARIHLQSRLLEKQALELQNKGMNITYIAGLKFRELLGIKDDEIESNRDKLNEFEKSVEENRQISIAGGPPNGNWQDWFDGVAYSPFPTSYRLESLSSLVNKDYFPELSDQQIEHFQTSFNNGLRSYCNDLNCSIVMFDRTFPFLS